ncbi:MAG: DUF2178 domain-containing protein [Anaerolineae bacterium]|jgi:hypothetical protein|nr:DUF2178 domain-containing protein [Anaerolineae bacterium]
MSYHEQRALIAFLGTLAVNVGYLVYMLPGQPAGDPYAPQVFHFWGRFFLLLIGVSIVVRILTVIVFSVVTTLLTRESEPAFEDERDRLIDLKAARYGWYVFIGGFVLAMLALVLEMPPTTMFLVLMLAGLSAQLTSELSEFLFYRRGI